MRDRISGYPFDVKREEGKMVLRVYPKGENLDHPNTPKFTLRFDKNDIKKLTKALS